MDSLLGTLPASLRIFAAGACLTLVWLVRGFVLDKNKYPLPPGPKGLPLLGNLYDAPAIEPWKKYREWSRVYNSDVIYLNMVGTPVIVLNSLTTARKLLEKSSSNYSSRPNMPMLNDLIGFDWHLAFMVYGDAWKECRKVFQQAFHPSQVLLYRPGSLLEVRKLLVRMLKAESDITSDIRAMAGSFILSVAYGIDVQPDNDPYIQQAERGMQAMAAAGTASSYLVDFFPALKYVPAWMPGAKFKCEAREWRKDVAAMPRMPLEYVKNGMKTNTFRACIASRLLENLPDDGVAAREQEQVISNVLGSIYAAGSDTTVSAISTFILAMVQYPLVQRKGQEAVDSALVVDRLPDYSDYGTIPYVEAIVRETLRWNPVTPLSLPRSVTSDDVYNGYYIPAGSTVLPNVWAMLRDESIYGPDTHLFRPERFLNDDGEINPDMSDAEEAFGFGRRLCPGMLVAVESMWMTMASILATYDIQKASDEEGVEIEPSGEYSSGMLSHPLPFQCKITPRSKAAVALIRAVEIEKGRD